ncbi:alpha/beta hydrolase [Bacillus sp. 31A1R]|uniref:Alpha/beta hydrolase n=1 Tax=Robertmurraya mangrovi TaxID=3098077 RepID=A0ABU5IWK1_9BACI|nr:alpha/beta hydrolase [Bacillus sp. 31A1R]MDZ5471510.1 alpha/beta hydrolase [Bacillus sp. 31A1R]
MFKSLVGGYVPVVKDQHGNVLKDSISQLEKLTLGGVTQWITIRGKNKNLPILLFLHGGPGSPQTGAQRKYNRVLEDEYIVVNWDQRGSGKSFTPEVKKESLTVNQLLSDAYELVTYLLNKFNQEKLFIMGHSVGAALGLLFAGKYPNLIHAYIGINQPVHRQEEEKKSYTFALDVAKRKHDKKAIAQLESIGFPENGLYRKIEDMVVQRTWLTKYKGVAYKKNAALINMNYLLSSHLTWKERLNFMKGFGFSSTNLWNEITSLNLFQLVPELHVPVYFIIGRHDKIVFHELVTDYFEQLRAKEKQLIVFEESGHLACFEEPGKFNQLMNDIKKNHL